MKLHPLFEIRFIWAEDGAKGLTLVRAENAIAAIALFEIEQYGRAKKDFVSISIVPEGSNNGS